ncbi:tetratricopeptide repeat protein 25 [Elysia marginata]|uniref:Outer dynein arm-docking complex subunit 4 n=1 Tax=Elysia marginata TaxID=1093978 RepID=A0AAV4IAT2_9GAST|nr:tetratricopeptide repeat protein 25 [Elysia marginata]
MRNGDKTCLVVRSKCFLMLGNSERALEDADAALEQDEEGVRDIRALNMKAEALYQKGDFETALVFYHRGNKLRPELQEFRLGIQKCEEAIDNSIGSPNSVQLEASGDLSYFYKVDDKKGQQKGYTKIGQPQKKEEKKERQRPRDSANSKTTKELLGQLYQDKEYLEKLFDGLSSSGPTQSDSYIKGRACDGLEYLNNRSDFWRQQKPMYARKRDRQSRSAKGSAANVGRGGQDPLKYVLRKLEEIDEAQSQGQYQESLDKCRHTLKRVEGMPEGSLKNKPDVLANLHSSMGNAYLEMGKFQKALSCHNRDLDIARDNELAEAESRALDNLGRTYARMGEYGEAIDIWKKKLPKSKSALESTWLYHEIGRCHLELGEYQEAKDYGEKSVAAAKEADDPGWKLHACVLVAQSEVKCGEYDAASDSFTQALELAEDQDDKAAQTAIKKALEEVNERIVKGGQGEDDDKSQDGHSEKNSPKSSDNENRRTPSPKEDQEEIENKENETEQQPIKQELSVSFNDDNLVLGDDDENQKKEQKELKEEDEDTKNESKA